MGLMDRGKGPPFNTQGRKATSDALVGTLDQRHIHAGAVAPRSGGRGGGGGGEESVRIK